MTEAAHPTIRRRRRWWLAVLAVLVVLVVGAGVAAVIDLPYYTLAPGDATSVLSHIVVPASDRHHVRGDVLLTDVSVTRVSALSYLFDRWDSDDSVVPASEILGPVTPAAQLAAQGYIEMAQSQSAAKAAALDRLGYHVGVRDAGTIVFAVRPGSPAAAVLAVGQIVTAVDGTPTPDSCALLGALHSVAPGTKVTMSVEQSSVTANAVLRSGPVVQRSVVLGRRPAGVGSSDCPGVAAGPGGYLGIETETWQDFDEPISVQVNTSDIGGPSAGLAMTLGIIGSLWRGDLTGGAVVAATGTIDPTGAVGDVGGVAQKTIAVQRAGATAFLVPPEEYAVAKSKAQGGLKVYSVATLDQALTVLHRLGGQIPPADPAT